MFVYSQPYQISVGSFRNQGYAQALNDRLEDAGLAAELETVEAHDRTFTRVLLSEQFSDSLTAYTKAQELQHSQTFIDIGINETWIRATENAESGSVQPGTAPPREAATDDVGHSTLASRSSRSYEQREDPDSGVVTGLVRDAATGSGVTDVLVADDNSTTFSDTTGFFALESPPGPTEIRFEKTGYTFNPVQLTVRDNEPTILLENTAIGSEHLATEEVRFVLTWGERPYDLDIHLRTPHGYHIYFANQKPAGAGANLDIDDTRSYGPETITITQPVEGEYTLWVHNYSRRPHITTSDANVRMYNDEGLVASWDVPTSGNGLIWMIGEWSTDRGFSSINEIR